VAQAHDYDKPATGVTLIGQLYAFLRNNFNAVRSSHSGTTAPTQLVAGMQWYDTSLNPPVLKIYDGASWRTVTVGDTDLVPHAATHAGGGSDILYAADIPISAVAGSDATTVQEALGDTLDGYHAGNAEDQIPVSNGTVCTNLNADLLEGKHGSEWLPNGIICMWKGSAATVPTGWALCDGANGTPNLQNRFIVAAGPTYGQGTTGGSATANIAHTHPFSATTSTEVANDNVADDIGGVGVVGTHPHTVSGTTGSGGSATLAILPPYYALCYIMKL
jgi:hypothetical protein